MKKAAAVRFFFRPLQAARVRETRKPAHASEFPASMTQIPSSMQVAMFIDVCGTCACDPKLLA